MPPPTDVNRATNHASFSSSPDPLIVEDAEASGEDFSPKYEVETCTPLKPMEDVQIPPLGLPCLNAGICWFTLIFS
jgi:hypothetical protein